MTATGQGRAGLTEGQGPAPQDGLPAAPAPASGSDAARFTPSSLSKSPGNSSPATPISRYSAKASGQAPNSRQMLGEPGPQAAHQNRASKRGVNGMMSGSRRGKDGAQGPLLSEPE